MRVACVFVTHQRAAVELNRQPHLKESPVLIVDRSPSRARPVVEDRSPTVINGMAIRAAVSRFLNAVVLDADESHYLQVFVQVLATLQGTSELSESCLSR